MTAYSDYLESAGWAHRRRMALRLAGNRCQLCDSPHRLNVHHRTYRRVGRETLRDLTVLCARCHEEFHDRLPLYESPQLLSDGQIAAYLDHVRALAIVAGVTANPTATLHDAEAALAAERAAWGDLLDIAPHERDEIRGAVLERVRERWAP